MFRSLETKLPLIRVTNTGLSFTVDSLGNQSKTTPLFEPEILISDLTLPATPPQTFYMKHGDWFVVLLVGILFLLGFRPFFKP